MGGGRAHCGRVAYPGSRSIGYWELTIPICQKLGSSCSCVIDKVTDALVCRAIRAWERNVIIIIWGGKGTLSGEYQEGRTDPRTK